MKIAIILTAVLTFLGSQGASVLYAKLFSSKNRRVKDTVDELALLEQRLEALRGLNAELQEELVKLDQQVKSLREENMLLHRTIIFGKQV